MDKELLTAAIIPSSGIGDALLMMIASEQLRKNGYHVTTYHPKLIELQEWFLGHSFEKDLEEKTVTKTLSEYDLVIFQNDNSSRAKHLIELFKNGQLKCLSIFYSSYSPSKHAPLSPLDVVFDPCLSMADNIACGSLIFSH